MSAKTLMLIILGLIVPLWPISLPLFWYLAYRSSKKDKEQQIVAARGSQVVISPTPTVAPETKKSSIAELKEAKELLDSGVINQEEFEKIKAEAFGDSSSSAKPAAFSETPPEGFLPVQDFARHKNIEESKLVTMIRDGFYHGKKVGDNWYVALSEFT